MILLLALAAIVVTLSLSAVTACIIVVRVMTAPSNVVVGDPPAGIGARCVVVSTDGGPALAGWFAPGRAGHGAVLLVHGLRSDRRALRHRMACLVRAGTAVLAVDLRGHGESAVTAVTFGHLEAHDVVVCLAWLRAAAPGERVGAIGISLGGAALLLASRNTAIDALVLESVFPDIRDAILNRARAVVGSAHRALAPLFTAVGVALTGLRPGDLRPIEALAAYPGPVLIVSGARDRLTTPAEARALYAVARGPKDLWIVEDVGHHDMAAAAGSAYDGRVLAFLGLHLKQRVPCD